MAMSNSYPFQYEFAGHTDKELRDMIDDDYVIATFDRQDLVCLLREVASRIEEAVY